MGADFVEKATKTFTKAWDKGLIELGTSDLLTREPSKQRRSGVVDLSAAAKLQQGDRVTVEAIGDGLTVRVGMTTVGQYSAPAPEIVALVQGSCGIADGVVEAVHKPAGIAEISVC